MCKLTVTVVIDYDASWHKRLWDINKNIQQQLWSSEQFSQLSNNNQLVFKQYLRDASLLSVRLNAQINTTTNMRVLYITLLAYTGKDVKAYKDFMNWLFS